MAGYLNLDYQFQFDWLKLKSAEHGYEFLSFADYGSDAILAKLNNTDMFSAGDSKLAIKFDKSDLDQSEKLSEVDIDDGLLIITTNVDKRTSIYKKLTKLNKNNPDWLKAYQDYQKVFTELAESQFGIKLKGLHVLKMRNIDYDELMNQLKLKVISSEQKEIDLTALISTGSNQQDQSMFDATLNLLNKSSSSEIGSVLKQYGAEAIWNTIIWYVDLAVQVQIIGSKPSSIKLNPYTASKVSSLKFSKGKLNALYNYEKMLKSGSITADNAVKMFVNSL
jgi:hypothetical protein